MNVDIDELTIQWPIRVNNAVNDVICDYGLCVESVQRVGPHEYLVKFALSTEVIHGLEPSKKNIKDMHSN